METTMKIALIGYGVENAGAYRYLVGKYPDAVYTIYDQSDAPSADMPEGVAFVGGLREFTDIDADLFVRSPGISPAKIHTDKPVTSATILFFEACALPIIGVTGSKGKGTTCSLITSILRAANKTVWLVGNIGAPALDALPSMAEGEFVVYELSSFQLWDLKQSPSTAVVLMIEPEHLDVHKDIEEYINAKANIARWQKPDDRLIYNANNEYSQQIARLSSAQPTAYPDTHAARVDNGRFYYGETEICSVTELSLPGEHNRENALAAIDAVWPWVSTPGTIAQGLRSFEGLEHRLKFVAEHAGIRFYDDSIATTPGSAIASIRSFDEPKVLILGGSSKGADFNELAREIANSDVRQVLLIGAEAARIQEALDLVEYSSYQDLGNAPMTDIVRTAQDNAEPGSVVILSPACASFGMFKNYADRGDQFIQAVSRL